MKKSPYIEESCEWICGGKDAYNYESTKESLNHLPNILIYIYIQLDQNEPEPYNTPYIINAFFNVKVEDIVGFVDEMPQELSEKFIKASEKYF